MLGRIFGNGARSGAPAKATVERRMPWEPDGKVVAGFAVANLIDYLLADLKGPRGIHTETLMTMVGALAGFSAQHAIWETVIKPGKLPAHGVGDAFDDGAFVLVETRTSQRYYFGDLLNSYLVPTGDKLASYGPGPHTLWGFLAAGVAQCGGKPISLEEIGEIFRNTAATVGSAQFGEPRLPAGHRPSMTPRGALDRAWPRARVILARDDAPQSGGKSLSPGHWPTVVALAAQKLVLQTKEVLDPALSMRIVFEAAIPMSKVDPTVVP